MPKEPKKKLLVKESEGIAESELASIEAPEAPMAPKAPPLEKVPDRRGKGAHVLANLEKGRERLKAVHEEKRKAKQELAEKAIQKKVALAQRQKEKLLKDYGLDSLSSDEEPNEEADDEEVYVPKEILAPKRVAKSLPPAKAPPAKAKPKARVVRYIEESEDESEEEIVYVKKPSSKAIAKAEALRSNTPAHRIIFY